MLSFVPLARARRKMTHGKHESGFIGSRCSSVFHRRENPRLRWSRYGPPLLGGSGKPNQSGYPRRASIRFALDQQEHEQASSRTNGHGAARPADHDAVRLLRDQNRLVRGNAYASWPAAAMKINPVPPTLKEVITASFDG